MVYRFYLQQSFEMLIRALGRIITPISQFSNSLQWSEWFLESSARSDTCLFSSLLGVATLNLSNFGNSFPRVSDAMVDKKVS